MNIEQITLRELRMRLKAPFETSFGVTQNRRILLVEVVADGVRGWGEVTTVESPSYNSETTDTAWHIVSDFIAPRIIGKDFPTAAHLAGALASIRGNYMAKAAVENALWDIEAQQKTLPLWKLVGGTRQEIVCGVSLGIQENPDRLINKVEAELGSGYRRIKLKIKPGKDLQYVAAVRQKFPDILLSVDANSAYRLDDADQLPCAAKLGNNRLAWSRALQRKVNFDNCDEVENVRRRRRKNHSNHRSIFPALALRRCTDRGHFARAHSGNHGKSCIRALHFRN